MLEQVTTGIVRERVHVAGVSEKIWALNSLVVLGFEPWPSAWQASASSIALCPSGSLANLKNWSLKPYLFEMKAAQSGHVLGGGGASSR